MNRLHLKISLFIVLFIIHLKPLIAQTVISIGKSSILYNDWSNTSLTGAPWYYNIKNRIDQFTVYTYFKNKHAILLNYNHCDALYGGIAQIGSVRIRHYSNSIFNYGIPIAKHLYLLSGPSILHKNDEIVFFINSFDESLIPVYAIVYGVSSQLDYELVHYKHLSVHAYTRCQFHQNTTSIYTLGLNVGYKIN